MKATLKWFMQRYILRPLAVFKTTKKEGKKK